MADGVDFPLRTFRSPESSALCTEPMTLTKMWARSQFLINKVYIFDDEIVHVLKNLGKKKRRNKKEQYYSITGPTKPPNSQPFGICP